MEQDSDNVSNPNAGKRTGTEKPKPAAQSAPDITIEPPPDDTRGRPGNRRIQPPSPVPPSQAQKSSRREQADNKGAALALSPGKTPRPRANSTGSSNSSASREHLLAKVKQGVRYVTDDFDIKTGARQIFNWNANFETGSNAKNQEEERANPVARGSGGGAAQPGGRGRGRGRGTGRPGRGRGENLGAPNQVRKPRSDGNLFVPGQGKDPSKPESNVRSDLFVPVQTEGGPGSNKGRSSSVPSRNVNRPPPLFDVQRDDGNQHKSQLAKQWFDNLYTFTEPLIENYARAKYEKVRIAVLDTGVEKFSRKNTPEYIRLHGEQIKGGRSFVGADNDHVPWNKDINGHGTHVTGLLLRVAPRAEIFVARVLKGWESTIDPSNVEEALKCCIDEWRVDIITMSFGFDKEHSGIDTQLNRAAAEHILVFAAASNNGITKSVNVAWPARAKTVFCIFSATGEGRNSSFNPPPVRGLNFATLGEQVMSDWPVSLLSEKEKEEGVSIALKSGTSFATPIAAAIAALVLEFARQPPLSDTPEVARQLKKMDRMEDVFERMSQQNVGRYHCVLPWLLFNAKEGRHTNEGDAYDRHSARGWAEGELVRLVSRHVQIF